MGNSLTPSAFRITPDPMVMNIYYYVLHVTDLVAIATICMTTFMKEMQTF